MKNIQLIDPIKSTYQYCPNCIVELQKQKKKMAGYKNWLVCPECGFRTRPEHPNVAAEVTEKAMERIRHNNEHQIKQPEDPDIIHWTD